MRIGVVGIAGSLYIPPFKEGEINNIYTINNV